MPFCWFCHEVAHLFLHQIKVFQDEKDRKRKEKEERDRQRLEEIQRALAEQAVFDKER